MTFIMLNLVLYTNIAQQIIHALETSKMLSNLQKAQLTLENLIQAYMSIIPIFPPMMLNNIKCGNFISIRNADPIVLLTGNLLRMTSNLILILQFRDLQFSPARFYEGNSNNRIIQTQDLQVCMEFKE